MGQKASAEESTAELTGRLEITNKELSDLPTHSLRNLKGQALHTIIFADNLIRRIAKPTTLLPFAASLTKLDLSNNGLQEIPLELGSLSRLTFVSLSFNQLTEIPEQIPAQWPEMESLILYQNRLRRVPETFPLMKLLTQCTVNANFLDISGFSPELLDFFELTTKNSMLPKIAGLNDQHVPSLICDGLYLGSYRSAENLEELQARNVTHVLTVAAGLQPRHLSHFEYNLIKVEDIETEDLKRYFSELTEWIHDAIANKNGVVLVHCAAGVSRSASIVIAYLMRYNGWGYKKAFKFAFSRRPCISPNSGFEEQLKQYSKELRNP